METLPGEGVWKHQIYGAVVYDDTRWLGQLYMEIPDYFQGKPDAADHLDRVPHPNHAANWQATRYLTPVLSHFLKSQLQWSPQLKTNSLLRGEQKAPQLIRNDLDLSLDFGSFGDEPCWLWPHFFSPLGLQACGLMALLLPYRQQSLCDLHHKGSEANITAWMWIHVCSHPSEPPPSASVAAAAAAANTHAVHWWDIKMCRELHGSSTYWMVSKSHPGYRMCAHHHHHHYHHHHGCCPPLLCKLELWQAVHCMAMH